MRGIGGEDQLDGRPQSSVFPGNVVKIAWEMIIWQEGPAVALRPLAETLEAPALPRVLIRGGSPCMEGRCTTGTEAGIASAVGAAAPARATREVGSK